MVSENTRPKLVLSTESQCGTVHGLQNHVRTRDLTSRSNNYVCIHRSASLLSCTRSTCKFLKIHGAVPTCLTLDSPNSVHDRPCPIIWVSPSPPPTPIPHSDLTLTPPLPRRPVPGLTLKQEALYSSWTTWPMLVLDACGKWGSSLCTTNMTSTFRERAYPSSSASSTRRSTSSCIAAGRGGEVGPGSWWSSDGQGGHWSVMVNGCISISNGHSYDIRYSKWSYLHCHVKLTLSSHYQYTHASLSFCPCYPSPAATQSLQLTGSEELTAAGAHGRPQVGRQLRRVLVMQDQLCDGPLAQGAAGAQHATATLRLQQLARHDRHQLTLHRARQHARSAGAAARPATWWGNGEAVTGRWR